ncbi:hypothetical protein QCA50_018459 [Cerrena zonata]|uniref:Uncharacterized protein n=1 Tax=Cerrena zonata TaxID=2478898 RepID=A0AAW0FH13_9APHY
MSKLKHLTLAHIRWKDTEEPSTQALVPYLDCLTVEEKTTHGLILLLQHLTVPLLTKIRIHIVNGSVDGRLAPLHSSIAGRIQDSRVFPPIPSLGIEGNTLSADTGDHFADSDYLSPLASVFVDVSFWPSPHGPGLEDLNILSTRLDLSKLQNLHLASKFPCPFIQYFSCLPLITILRIVPDAIETLPSLLKPTETEDPFPLLSRSVLRPKGDLPEELLNNITTTFQLRALSREPFEICFPPTGTWSDWMPVYRAIKEGVVAFLQSYLSDFSGSRW